MANTIMFVSDDRRATVNELSNQKGVMQKANGWKLHYLAAQMEELVCCLFLDIMNNKTLFRQLNMIYIFFKL